MVLDIDNVNLVYYCQMSLSQAGPSLLVLVSWLSALAASDSPRSLFYQTLIADSGQGFFVDVLDHILCVSRCPIFLCF